MCFFVFFWNSIGQENKFYINTEQKGWVSMPYISLVLLGTARIEDYFPEWIYWYSCFTPPAKLSMLHFQESTETPIIEAFYIFVFLINFGYCLQSTVF